MKRFLIAGIYAMSLALASMTLVACSDDDDNDKGGGGPNDKAPAAAKAVDLGLTVKWANMNIGATSPEEYGSYFAWGEVEEKSEYTWAKYKYLSDDKLTKYCTDASSGTVDKKTTLDAADDAAAVNWGGKWRMPTKAEQDELRTKCTWTWMAEGNTEYNGKAGYKVTGTNGNSIFLPAAGYRDGTTLGIAGTYGGYWSASLNEGYPDNAYGVGFGSEGVDWYGGDRYFGQSVRAVLPE